MTIRLSCAFLTSALSLVATGAQAQDDLAKKLVNPVAELISVPLEYNYDRQFGTARDGHRSLMNVQPVTPFGLNDEWNIISRTIVPIISQTDVRPGTSPAGIGDIKQSLFFSPRTLGPSGAIWGVGPVFYLPTGTDSQLSARKWGGGPTAVVLMQDGHWTYGALVNHIWAAGGNANRRNISSTYLQPFVAYTTKEAWTFAVNTESSYDWKAKQWSVPINVTVGKLLFLGKQPVNLTAGLRYWAEGPNAGPHNLGFRLSANFLFPK
ncbi:transporter [Variovorax rhizosphaerae]|uniref:Transporter n=1 Tax=Variovorax rhizosphaerae TaxID=1836200 RepID=A0ABU8WQ73_9BURK